LLGNIDSNYKSNTSEFYTHEHSSVNRSKLKKLESKIKNLKNDGIVIKKKESNDLNKLKYL
jgi:hypothetical protein